MRQKVNVILERMRERKKLMRPHAKRASLDGIILRSSGLRSGAPQSYRPNQGQSNPSLNSDIKRREGFYPLNTSTSDLGFTAAGAEAKALDDPIFLDNEKIVKQKNDKKDPPAHKDAKSHPRLRKGLKRTSLLLLALILAGGLFLGVKAYIAQRHLFRGGGNAPALDEKIDINKLRVEGDGRVNILLLGIGGPGHDGADLTDTIMIASLDPVNNKVALLSIPRDLWVKIPGYGSQKINATYTYGKEASKSKNLIDQERDGLALVDKTLGAVIGIPIHYHALVDFVAFQQTVNALGGVTVNVPETLYDPTIAWENHYNPTIAKAGIQTFDGGRALLYVKSRETSSDFARGERQRLMIVAIKDKIFSVGTFSNPARTSQLLSSFGDNIYTDFSLNDIMRLYHVFSKLPSNDISSLDLVTPPHAFLTTANIGGLSVVEPKTGLYNYKEIQSYIRNTLRDGLLAKENSSVAIYNATDVAGLATTKADELKSFGYNVTTVDSLPKATNAATTVIVDLSNGADDKYTRHYLELRFGVKAQTSLASSYGISPPAGTKFVIIAGKDANKSSQ